MSYTYHGVELVNCRPPTRRGPLTHFPQGQYKGSSIESVIRRDPRYAMWAIKEWLNVSPKQAFLFEEVTGGGVIPDAYIVKDPQESPKPEEVKEVGDWICPNYDFDSSSAPKWWPEFKRKKEGMSPIKVRDLFEDYQRKELEEVMKEWYDEYR